MREIQLSKRDVLDILAEAASPSPQTSGRSFCFVPSALSRRDCPSGNAMPDAANGSIRGAQLQSGGTGSQGTGKSHLFQQVSPYAHLISGGKATVARMFVNNATGQRGLVCQYDVVCFDEVSGISFDQKDGVNIMKGYMESGEFSGARRAFVPMAVSFWSATSMSMLNTSNA